MGNKLFILLLTGISLCQMFCNQGLSPDETSAHLPGRIEGTIYFQNWPAPDSLLDLRVVVFKNYPPENILTEILNNQAYVYPSIFDTTRLPLYVDSTRYSMEVPAGDYAYVVAAHQYGPDLYNDWRAVGQYDTDADSLPTPIRVLPGEVLVQINIWVDFSNLPPQPF